MKKFWFEILLTILGILLLCSSNLDPTNASLVKELGGYALLIAFIWFCSHLIIIKKNKDEDRTFPTKQNSNQSNAFPVKNQEMNTPSSSSVQTRFNPVSNKELERKKVLDDQVLLLRASTQEKILDFDDLNRLVNIRIDSKEKLYIAEHLECPMISKTVFEVYTMIEQKSFSDTEAVTLLTYGTTSLYNRVMYSFREKTSGIPTLVFDYLFEHDKMVLLKEPFYSVELFTRLLHQLKGYELIGFRMSPINGNEDTDGTFSNCLTDEEIPYYENAETDVVYIAEQHFSDYPAMRKTAFDKVFCQKYDLVDTLERLDDITEYEAKKILERGNSDEIKAMLERGDNDQIVGYLSMEQAIKVLLGLLYPDASETVKDSYSFNDKEAVKKIINDLSGKELLGNDDYDIIKFIEDEMGDSEELRTLAFAKLCSAGDISEAITRWDTVTKDEITKLLERNKEEEISALFDRDDSDSIVCDFPEEVAIKSILGVAYPDAAESVKDHYRFSDELAFKKVINELSGLELLGTEDHYDIIKVIEDEMADNEELRTLAFAKLCSADDMSEAIAAWDNVTKDEIAKIMERNKEEEVSALFDRDDSDSIVSDFPEEVAIKSILGVVYPDAAESVKDNYRFSDELAFKKVINELSGLELLGTEDHYDIIKVIEDEMADNEELRALAFAKLCSADDISEAIAAWDNVTQDEIAKIVERNKEEELSALFDRDDSDSIISDLPDNFVIKQHLLGSDDSIHDEYFNRVDEEAFRTKVEKFAKKLSSRKLTEQNKEADVQDLPDEIIIKARLDLIDFSECSFDSDDISGEFSDRIGNDDFRRKVESITNSISM